VLVLLTTGGTGNRKEVVYRWAPKGQKPQECRTAHFPIAAYKFFRPDKVIFAATQEAAQHENCLKVKEALKDKVEIVIIPDGSSEDELWEIFDVVSNAVPKGARIILDITHGYRSQPLLLFGVVAYSGRTKHTILERIVYGALEAGKERPDGLIHAPVFDLTVLADLLEWLHAVDTFAIRSDASKLADLLITAQDRQWAVSRAEGEGLPKKLKTMARRLEEFSDSVRLLRPLDAIKAAAKVTDCSKEVEQESAQWARPFAHILGNIARETAELGMERPEELRYESLQRQLLLIKHYIHKDLLIQAVLLAREWVVSWVAWCRRKDNVDWLCLPYREQISNALNGAAKHLAAGGEGTGFGVPSWFTELPQSGEVVKLWVWLRGLRNDVAHCAMNPRAAGADSVKQRAMKLPCRLATLLELDQSRDTTV